MLVLLVLDRGDAGALLGAGEDHRRAVGGERLRVGGVDRLEVVAVDLLHVPAAGRGARRQRGGVPLVHGRAALAEPVDVDDRDQVVEAGVAGVLEGLPHRALGELGVAAEDPDPEVGLLEPLAGERDPDRDRQALAERAGGDVDPGDLRGRVALQAGAELAEGEQLLVVDRARPSCTCRRAAARRGPWRRRGGRWRGSRARRSRSAGSSASSTAIRSAADIEEVGWPEPAAAAARTESTRSCCASSCSCSRLMVSSAVT